MSTFRTTAQFRLVTFLGILLGITLFLGDRTLAYRWLMAPKSTLTHQNGALTQGTRIPVRYERSAKILLTKEESFPLTLIVADNIKDAQGMVIIPDGSQIIGEIRPFNQGSRFFSEKLLIYSQNQPIKVYPLDAVSQWVNRVETFVKGMNPDSIVKGATVGEAAKAVIAAIKGEQPLNNRSIFNPSGLDSLAGWLLTGERIELLSIVPERDLTLTLQSEFQIK